MTLVSNEIRMNGELIAVEMIEDDSVSSPLEQFAALPAEQATAVLAVALGLINQAGPLWTATVALSEADTAKPALDIVAGVVLEAALPLLPE